MIVVGENQKFAAAIISPDFNYLKIWCAKHDIEFKEKEELIKDPDVLKRFQKEVNHYNKLFAGYEQVKRYHLVPEEWTMQNGLLSPTLKIKRNKLEKFYKDRIDQMFGLN